jgi:hypothetical protein
MLMCSSDRKVEAPRRYRCLRGREPCHFLPALKALDQLLSIGLGREVVASRSEMLGEGTRRGEKPLGVPWRLEPLQAPLPLPGGLVGIFRAIVEIAMLAVLHARPDLALGRAVALELVRDEHPWHVGHALEQLPEACLGGVLVPPTLDQDIQDVAVLIDCTPQIVPFAMNGEKDLIEVPRVARPGTPPPQLIRLRLAELPAPLANGLVGHDYATDEQEFLHIAVAEAE